MWNRSVGAIAGLWLVACGGEAAENPKMSGGSAGMPAAAGSGGTPSTGGSESAGSSSGGDSGSGGASVAASSCAGAFGPAQPVLVVPTGTSVNGVTVTADELELYYTSEVREDPAAVPEVVRRRRAGKGEMFGQVETLPELAGVCGDKRRINPDISEDGLTLYVTCTSVVDSGSEGISPLRVARRESRSQAFVLDAAPIGQVFASAGLSSDELTAYTDGEVFDTAPQMFTRASKTASFVGPQPVPGVSVPFRSPDISSDGLSLFGAAADATSATGASAIFRANRASKDAPFSAPERLELQITETAVGAPNITAGCALYVITVGTEGTIVQRALPQ